MIALLQRVTHATLRIDGREYSRIGPGLVVLLGIEKDDDESRADRMLQRLLSYRVFADDEGRMNRSLRDVAGDLMLVSQFTLAASTDKGLRPSFSAAMPPDRAEQLYDYMVNKARTESGVTLATGRFGADMKVALENDGPVTFLLRG